MKTILFIIAILLSGGVNAQKGKPLPPIDSVRIKNNILYEYRDGIGFYGGTFSLSPTSGISLDVNGNLNIAERPGDYGVTGFGNFIFGNGVSIDKAFKIAALATDTRFFEGSQYSISGGDAHRIGGYSSTTFGVGNENFIYSGTAIGFQVRLGTLLTNNLYSRSAGVGSNMFIDNEDVYLFGTAGDFRTPQTQQGSYLIFGNRKFGLMPDGKVLINGIAYNFPTTQGAGVLTNDGNGNLSWTNPAIASKARKFKLVDLRTGQIIGAAEMQ